jgi:hypothetical protein
VLPRLLRGWALPLTGADKLGKPINRFSNKIGSEAFWPTTLDKESNKAARILKSFCSKLLCWLFLSCVCGAADSENQRMDSTPKKTDRRTRRAPRGNKEF